MKIVSKGTRFETDSSINGDRMKFLRILICYVAIIFFVTVNVVASTPFLNLDEIRMYDSYGKLSWKDEKLRLRTLADELKSMDSQDVVYLYFYGGKRTCLSEARKSAAKARSYLVDEQRVLSERIVLKEGGYREALTIEIYILPTNFTMSASPTLSANETPKKCINQK